MLCQKRINPPVLLLAFLLSLPAAHFLAPKATVLPGLWSVLGIIPVVVGIVLNIVADNLFTAHNTSIKPSARPSSLVTGGPYAISRNPMYLGFGLLIIGVAVMLGSAIPLTLAATFFPLADRLFIRAEEATLCATFASEWTSYAARVRRWI